MARTFTLAAAVLGLLAVLAGTFGAHGLESRLQERDLAVWDTASTYHMYHALALLGLAALDGRFRSRALAMAGGLFIVGVAIFSGSLYSLAMSEMLTGQRQNWLGMITPIGGFCFISGWLCLIIGAVRGKMHQHPTFNTQHPTFNSESGR